MGKIITFNKRGENATSRMDELVAAMSKMPRGLSYDDFVCHPAMKEFNLDILFAREAYELYDMY